MYADSILIALYTDLPLISAIGSVVTGTGVIPPTLVQINNPIINIKFIIKYQLLNYCDLKFELFSDVCEHNFKYG